MNVQSFRCPHCQKQFRLKDDSQLGKQAKCTNCNQLFQIRIDPPTNEAPPLQPQYPVPNQAPAPHPTPTTRTQTPNTNKRTTGKQNSSTKSKSSKGSLGKQIGAMSPKKKILLFAGGSGVLLMGLVCIITCILTIWIGEKQKHANLAFVYPNSKYIYRVSPAQLTESKAWNRYAMENDISLADLERYSGLQASEIESITLGISERFTERASSGRFPDNKAAWGYDFVVVVRTKVDIDKDAIRGWTGAGDPTGFSGYQVYPCPPRFSLCFINDKTLLFGTKKLVEPTLDKSVSASRLDEFKFMNSKDEIQFAYNEAAAKQSLSAYTGGFTSDYLPIASGESLNIEDGEFTHSRLTVFGKKSGMRRLQRMRRTGDVKIEKAGSQTILRTFTGSGRCLRVTKSLLGIVNLGDPVYKTNIDLKSSDPKVRAAAIPSLAKQGSEGATKYLVSLLEKPEYQNEAANQLTTVRNGFAERYLVQYLKPETNVSSKVRELTIGILAERGTTMSVVFLEKWTQDSKLGTAATEAIEKIKRRAPRRRRR